MRQELAAEGLGLGEQLLLLEDIEHGEGGGAGQRVAGEGAAEAAGGGAIHHVGAAQHARERQAAGHALGHRDQVGDHAAVLDGEQLCGAPEAALDLVGDQQDAVARGELAQGVEEAGGRGHKAALAEHRLDDHGGHAIWRALLLEQLVQTLDGALAIPAAILVGEGRVIDLGGEGAEVLAVRLRLARERQAHQGAAVEAVGEGHDAGAPGEGARDLHRVLGGLGARGYEHGLFGEGAGGQGAQALGQADVGLVHANLEAGVGHALQLGLHCLHHAGVIMAHVQHADAADKVDILVAVYVPEAGALGPTYNNWVGVAHAACHMCRPRVEQPRCARLCIEHRSALCLVLRRTS